MKAGPCLGHSAPRVCTCTPGIAEGKGKGRKNRPSRFSAPALSGFEVQLRVPSQLRLVQEERGTLQGPGPMCPACGVSPSHERNRMGVTWPILQMSLGRTNRPWDQRPLSPDPWHSAPPPPWSVHGSQSGSLPALFVILASASFALLLPTAPGVGL